MPVSEAKKKANTKWNRENASRYWRATIMIPIEDKERIQAAANNKNLSLSEYVRMLIEQDMKQ